MPILQLYEFSSVCNLLVSGDGWSSVSTGKPVEKKSMMVANTSGLITDQSMSSSA